MGSSAASTVCPMIFVPGQAAASFWIPTFSFLKQTWQPHPHIGGSKIAGWVGGCSCVARWVADVVGLLQFRI